MKRTYSVHFPITCLLILANSAPNLSAAEPSRGNTSSRKCSDAVTLFVATPTSHNYEDIRPLMGDTCWSTLTVKQIQSLDALVAAGNKFAAQLMAPHLRQLDGGELEDALRAFGRYSIHDMRDFLSLVASRALTQQEASDALTMLPLELDDQFDAQLAALRTRRTAVENVHDSQLQAAAKSALHAIDAFMAEVETARSGQNSAKPLPQ